MLSSRYPLAVRGLLFGLLLALSAARVWSAGEVPEVTVTDQKPLGKGTAGAYRGTVEGRVYVFKRNDGTHNIRSLVGTGGNAEGEVLGFLILRALGHEAPRARLVTVAGQKGIQSMTEFVGDTWKGQPVLKMSMPPELEKSESSGSTSPDPAAVLDLDQIRLLQLTDLVIGNGDRHGENYMFVKKSSGRHQVLPIDHNWAFVDADFKPDTFMNPGSEGWQRNMVKSYDGMGMFGGGARIQGTPSLILERNPLYQLVLDHSPVVESYRPGMRRIKEVLTDAFLHQILEQLPAGFDPGRKERIARTLAWRRDRLPQAMETFLASRADRLSPNPFRDRILRGDTAVSGAAFHFIVTYLLGGQEPTGMEPPTMRLAEARRALTSRGVPRDEARARVDRLMIRTINALGEAQVQAYGAPDPRSSAPPAPAPSPSPGAAAEVPQSVPRPAILGEDPLFHGGAGGPGARDYARFQQLNHRYLQLDRRLASLIRSGDTQASAADRARRSFPPEEALVEEQRRVIEELTVLLRDLGQTHFIDELEEEALYKTIERDDLGSPATAGSTAKGPGH